MRIRGARTGFPSRRFLETRCNATGCTTAIEACQLALKITRTTRFDQQLSVHLLDCDVLLTGDKRFHTVVSSIRKQVDIGIAPTALAVRADIDAIASIAEALERTFTR